jgi:hypothetical protein
MKEIVLNFQNSESIQALLEFLEKKPKLKERKGNY